MKGNLRYKIGLLAMSFIICMGIVSVPKAVFAENENIYWGLDINNKLWISHGSIKVNREMKKQGMGRWPRGGTTGGSDPDMKEVVEIEFLNDVIAPINSDWLFDGFSACKQIKKLNNLNTSRTTSMRASFRDCKSLQSLDVSGFNTSSVTDMSRMFDGCQSLESLDLSSFDTALVRDMRLMFRGCKSLRNINLSKFNTSSAVYMPEMFEGCASLKSLSLDNFDTSKVTDMSSMFNGCETLRSLFLSNFDTSEVIYMDKMFKDCKLLPSLSLSSFNTSKVYSMSGMFEECSSLKSLVLSNFNTSKVKDMKDMFFGCRSLKSLDLSNFVVSGNASYMLYFDGYGSRSAIEELTVSASLNKALEKANPFGLPKYLRVWYIKNAKEVRGTYDVNGYDTSQGLEMEALVLSGNKITYLAGYGKNTPPVIAASDRTVEFGTTLEAAIKDFRASDSEDGSLPLVIKDRGGYNPKISGTYIIKISATDSRGSETVKQVRITVKPKMEGDIDYEAELYKRIRAGGEEVDGAEFATLMARSTRTTKSSVVVTWRKVPNAVKYVVYGNKCGTKNKYERLIVTTGTSVKFKKILYTPLRNGAYYKFVVAAFDANGKDISVSKTVHVATKGGRVGNDKKVITAAKKNKVKLKQGKKFKLKAKAVPKSKKLKVKRHRKIVYETSNENIVTVTKGGKIKAVSKGSCYVYAVTQNGVHTRVKVTVR
ncbi:MAG: BspA family leucine-rich repeat surface protein [Mogibacterium sp.]|nr:BspA family leucine-rich repeat surface protein [Mogibacterium sp.]